MQRAASDAAHSRERLRFAVLVIYGHANEAPQRQTPARKRTVHRE